MIFKQEGYALHLYIRSVSEGLRHWGHLWIYKYQFVVGYNKTYYKTYYYDNVSKCVYDVSIRLGTNSQTLFVGKKVRPQENNYLIL